MPKSVADSPALLILFTTMLFLVGPRSSWAGGIIVLEESDSLRSRSEGDSYYEVERTPRGIRIEIDTDEDSESGVFEIHTDWDSESTTDIVRFGTSVVVGEDEIVEGSVVAIGGDIRIDGIVEEDVVALGGTVHLGPAAVVEGDAVILGGRLIKDPGAEVYGEDVGISFTPAGWFSGTEDLGGALLRSTILVSTFLFLLLSGILFHLMFPGRMVTIANVLRRRVWMSLIAGVALHVLFWPLVALLTIIVIGIPIAILLPVVYLLVSIVGSVVAAALLGGRLQGADLESRGGWIRSLSLGLILLTGWLAVGDALASVGGAVSTVGQIILLVGFCTNCTLATIGMGAAVLSRFGRSRPALSEPPVSPSMPPAPPIDPISAGA